MYRIENVVGKLVEIQVTHIGNMDEMIAFRDEVIDAVNRAPGRAVAVVDLRIPRIFAPDVATALEDMLKRANPKIDKSAVLLSRDHAVFSLQLERIIREAGNPSRRTFRDPEHLKQWLRDSLTPAEQTRLDRALT